MKETSKKKKPEMNDRLADFTDQVLAGKNEQSESQEQDELRGLEETILRLKRLVSDTQLDEPAIRRMQVNLRARLRNESERTGMSLWQKWFKTRRPHPQIALGIYVLSVIIFAWFIAPHLTETGPSIAAVAITPSPIVLTFTVLAGVGLLVIWINHRK